MGYPSCKPRTWLQDCGVIMTETVKIHALPEGSEGFWIINKYDFDPKIHTEYGKKTKKTIPTDELDTMNEDELKQLAEDEGIEIDGRWGMSKMREKIRENREM